MTVLTNVSTLAAHSIYRIGTFAAIHISIQTLRSLPSPPSLIPRLFLYQAVCAFLEKAGQQQETKLKEKTLVQFSKKLVQVGFKIAISPLLTELIATGIGAARTLAHRHIYQIPEDLTFSLSFADFKRNYGHFSLVCLVEVFVLYDLLSLLRKTQSDANNGQTTQKKSQPDLKPKL
ncbi:MAG: hypothetical protein AAF443_08010 [Chlamydiota bacterium]